MRFSASALVFLATPFLSTSASAQYGEAEIACERGEMSACLELRYGRCMHDDPRIAISACTRQLLSNRDSLWDDRPGNWDSPRDQARRYALRATARAKLGEFNQALADYERAIRASEEIYWIHALQGSALFSVGYEQEALAALNRAVSLEPDDALLLNARARVLSSAVDDNVRNGPRAIADAQRASELVPGQPAFVVVLATAYAENGEFGKAVETQQDAIDMLVMLEPKNRDAFDRYTSRLTLYQEGMPFRRDISCGTEEGPSNPDDESDGPDVAPYIVFCLPGGNYSAARIPGAD